MDVHQLTLFYETRSFVLSPSSSPAVFQGVSGVLVFIVFGSQTDIWREAWALCAADKTTRRSRKRRKESSKPVLPVTSDCFPSSNRPSFVLPEERITLKVSRESFSKEGSDFSPSSVTTLVFMPEKEMSLMDALMELEKEVPPRERRSSRGSFFNEEPELSRERRSSRGSLFKEEEDLSPWLVPTLAFLPEKDEDQPMDLMDALKQLEKEGED